MDDQRANQEQTDEHDTEVTGHRSAIPGGGVRPALPTKEGSPESDAEVAGHGRNAIPGGGVRPKSQQQESNLVDDAEVAGHGRSVITGGPVRAKLPARPMEEGANDVEVKGHGRPAIPGGPVRPALPTKETMAHDECTED